nr:hypothetical protein [Fimbriiglobus ruber]
MRARPDELVEDEPPLRMVPDGVRDAGRLTPLPIRVPRHREE